MNISDAQKEEMIAWAAGLLSEAVISTDKAPHGDEGVVFKLTTAGRTYFLKIKESTFMAEIERLQWLQEKLPVPRVIGSSRFANFYALLITGLPGKDLRTLCKEWPADKVVSKLSYALLRFHRTAKEAFPFDEPRKDGVLVHGDACLPNFIFLDDELSGYIDLGECRIADPEVDLAAAVWSLQYNLGPGHGTEFLRQYGHPLATPEETERLRLAYVQFQQAAGFLRSE